MNLGVFATGCLVLTLGILAYSLQLPTITFQPFPALTTWRPLQTIAYILFGAGGILAVCGVFKNAALRVLLSFLVILAIIYLMFQTQLSDLMGRWL